MNFMKIDPCDLVNGEGLRVSLFVSGCTLACPGCFNRAAQNFKAGSVFTQDSLEQLLAAIGKPTVTGLSILGGEPLHAKNVSGVFQVVSHVRTLFPEKTIWVWTGYTYEQLVDVKNPQHDLFAKLLASIDVLVDGPFIQSQHRSGLLWRGSENQRVLRLSDRAKRTAPCK